MSPDIGQSKLRPIARKTFWIIGTQNLNPMKIPCLVAGDPADLVDMVMRGRRDWL
jgi:hypothetical protein